jgi:hypothetical protein
MVVGDLRVQRIEHRDGRRSWTIAWPGGAVDVEADRFLPRHVGSGTQKTYALYLVDYLLWLERECLTLDTVGLARSLAVHGDRRGEVRRPLGTVDRRKMRSGVSGLRAVASRTTNSASTTSAPLSIRDCSAARRSTRRASVRS